MRWEITMDSIINLRKKNRSRAYKSFSSEIPDIKAGEP